MLFPDVLRDGGDAPANLLCHLNGHVVPCASCLHGIWVENVGAGQFGILVNLVLCSQYYCIILWLVLECFLLLDVRQWPLCFKSEGDK